MSWPNILCHSSPAASTKFDCSFSHALTARAHAVAVRLCHSFPKELISDIPGIESQQFALP
jgi:hypothetical protein